METLTGQQLQCINGVREWYNIMYASEISTLDGKELLRGIDHGNPQSVQFFPTKRAPKQARPNRKSFRLWKRVLAQLTEPNSNRLKSPLGKWTSHHSTSGIWRSYESKDKVYELILSPTVLQRDVPTNRLPAESDGTIPKHDDNRDRTRHTDTNENNNDNSANNIDNMENNKVTNENNKYDENTDNVTDVTENVIEVTENVMDITENVTDVTEIVTDKIGHVINDDNDIVDGHISRDEAPNGTTIGKYWKVYDQRGSSLIYKGTVSFSNFQPSHATPIRMNTFSNHTVGFERIPLLPVPTDTVTFNSKSSFTTLIASQPQWVQELLEEYSYPVQDYPKGNYGCSW